MTCKYCKGEDAVKNTDTESPYEGTLKDIQYSIEGINFFLMKMFPKELGDPYFRTPADWTYEQQLIAKRDCNRNNEIQRLTMEGYVVIAPEVKKHEKI
jgi:hypothetical protein